MKHSNFLQTILLAAILAFSLAATGQTKMTIPVFQANATHQDSALFISVIQLTQYDELSIILEEIPEPHTDADLQFLVLGYAKGHWNKIKLSMPYTDKGIAIDPKKAIIKRYRPDLPIYAATWQAMQKYHPTTLKLYPTDSAHSTVEGVLVSFQQKKRMVIKTPKTMRVFPEEYEPLGMVPKDFDGCVDIFLKGWGE